MFVVLAVAAGLAGWRLTTASTATPAEPAGATRAVTSGQAITLLQARVANAPEDVDAWQQLAIAYTREAGSTGDPALYWAAQQAVDRATALAPDALPTQLAAGNLLLSLHQFPAAHRVALDVTAAHPNSPEAVTVLVDALVELGRYDEAEVATQRLLDLRPALPALARASYLRELHGDLVGATLAMQEAENAGAGAPLEAARVASLLGDLARRQGDADGASRTYDRALRLSPDLTSAVVGKALLQADSGDLDGAIAALDEQARRTPSPEVLLAQLALQQAAGDRDGAAATSELVRVVLQLLRDGDQVVDLEFALFEADHGEPATAVDLATRAHEVRPDNVFVQDALAWALHRDGRSDEAVPHARDALRLGSLDPLLRWHAAEILAAAGERDEAAQVLAPMFSTGAWVDARQRAAATALRDALDVA